MRTVRDIGVALAIGVAWAIVISSLIGWLAAASTDRLAEIDALARGDQGTFVMLALLRDLAIYAIPSLFAGYLIVRLMDRPMLSALIAGVPAFLSNAYSVGPALSGGGLDGARGAYLALNAVLVLLAIASCTALIRAMPRRLPEQAA